MATAAILGILFKTSSPVHTDKDVGALGESLSPTIGPRLEYENVDLILLMTYTLFCLS